MAGDKKYRAFTGILYPDSTSYNFQEKIDTLSLLFDKWAYIEHDNDVNSAGEPKKTHFHWVGYRKAPVMVKTVANGMGLRDTEVEYAKRGWLTICRYLIHLENEEKYQYSADDVTANFDYLATLGDELTAEDKARGIMSFVLSADSNIDILSLGRWSLDNGYWSEFLRAYPYWQRLCEAKKFDV